jgi:hypothetical protein
MTVASHNDCVFEFVVNGFLNFNGLWGLAGKPLSLGRKSDHLLIDELETVVNRKIFADVVDDQVNAALEDPGRGKEPGPSLHSVIEDFSLGWHEETRISSDLAEFWISHLSLDDRVDET